MNLKEINWDTLKEDVFEDLKLQFGEKIISKGVSLYGRGYGNYEIYEILNKIKSDTTE